LTARAKLVATLTEEILGQSEKSAFPIASEHELCRRFDLSRVTVRLALSDLENRGLIFRRHGKGTFAHGCAGRIYRNIGILARPDEVENRPWSELVRGAQSVQGEHCAGVLLINVSPTEWGADLARTLNGIIVRAAHATAKELEVLRDRNLPFFLFGDTELAGPRLVISELGKMADELLQDYFRAGEAAATALNRAALTGRPPEDVTIASAGKDSTTIVDDDASGLGEGLRAD
jgi:hypothetical protein